MQFPSKFPLRCLDHRLFAIFCLLLLLVAPALAAGLEGAEVVGLATKCLDVRGGSTAAGADVVLFRCHGGANQRWDLPPRGFTGEIVGVGGQCLDIRGTVRDRARVEMRGCTGSPTQQWRFGQDGRIVGAEGLCLGVLGADATDSAPVGLGGCRGRIEQLWRARAENRFTWTSLAAGAHVRSLWLDPAGSGVAYANVEGAGLFRSEDAGESWSPLLSSLGTTEVFLLAVSPADPQMVYATGFASRNGGQSWREMTRFHQGASAITPATHDPREVFILDGRRRVYRSRDAGKSWSKISRLRVAGGGTFIGRLVAHPLEPDTLFASIAVQCDNAPCGRTLYTFRSSDGALSWQEVSAAAPFFFFQLAFDPDDPRWVFASTTGGLRGSSDGGSSWSDIDPHAGGEGLLGDLVVDPERPDRLLFSSGRRLFTSLDRGSSWFSSPLLFPADSSFALLGQTGRETPIYGSLWLHPTHPEAGVAGLYVSHDGGTSWRRLGRGLSALAIEGVAMAPSPGAPVYGFGQSGLFTSADGGTSWRQLLSGARAAVAVDPAQPGHLLASDRQHRVVRSTDGGASFVRSREGIDADDEIRGFAYRPQAAGSVFALGSGSSSDRVYRSRDGGASWQQMLEVPLFSTVLAANADGSRIFLGGEQGLYVSVDGGDSWQPQAMAVLRLACDRNDAAQVWLLNPEALLLSEDRGASWRAVALPAELETPYQVRSLDAAQGGVVIAGLLGEVWRSRDRGASWTRLGDGLLRGSGTWVSADPTMPDRVWLAVRGLGVLVGDFSD